MFYVALLRGYACPCKIYIPRTLLLLEMDTADVVKGCFMVVFLGKRLIQRMFLLLVLQRRLEFTRGWPLS